MKLTGHNLEVSFLKRTGHNIEDSFGGMIEGKMQEILAIPSPEEPKKSDSGGFLSKVFSKGAFDRAKDIFK